MSCLKFSGKNDDEIDFRFISATEVISNAILFVYPLRGALDKMYIWLF